MGRLSRRAGAGRGDQRRDSAWAWQLPHREHLDPRLLAVLAAAIRFGRGLAISASLAAFLTFNWFFVGPVHTLLVARPEEIVDLLVLLLAAVVTGQLAARERARHQEAEAREREAVLLQAIIAAMSEGDLDLERGLRSATELLRRDLGLATVRVVLDYQALTDLTGRRRQRWRTCAW